MKMKNLLSHHTATLDALLDPVQESGHFGIHYSNIIYCTTLRTIGNNTHNCILTTFFHHKRSSTVSLTAVSVICICTHLDAVINSKWSAFSVRTTDNFDSSLLQVWTCWSLPVNSSPTRNYCIFTSVIITAAAWQTSWNNILTELHILGKFEDYNIIVNCGWVIIISWNHFFNLDGLFFCLSFPIMLNIVFSNDSFDVSGPTFILIINTVHGTHDKSFVQKSSTTQTTTTGPASLYSYLIWSIVYWIYFFTIDNPTRSRISN